MKETKNERSGEKEATDRKRNATTNAKVFAGVNSNHFTAPKLVTRMSERISIRQKSKDYSVQSRPQTRPSTSEDCVSLEEKNSLNLREKLELLNRKNFHFHQPDGEPNCQGKRDFHTVEVGKINVVEPGVVFSPITEVKAELLCENNIHKEREEVTDGTPSSPEDLVLPVHQLEEFAVAFIEIIRSLFILTEDLEARLEYYLAILNSFLPSVVQSWVLTFYPLLQRVAFFIEILFVGILIILELIFESLSAIWQIIRSHHPEYLVGIFFGFLFCFFGSFFFTTIAAFEAFRLFGLERLLNSLGQIKQDLRQIRHSSRRFSKIIEENREKSNYLSEKFGDIDRVDKKRSLILQSAFATMAAVNPHELAQAIFVLNAAFLAVIATLKIRFAKTVTLGNSISNLLQKPLLSVAEPILEAVIPQEISSWGHFILLTLLKIIAISLAWTIERLFASVHSATRGGLFMSRNLVNFLLAQAETSSTTKDFVQTYREWIVNVVGGLLALLGLYFQLIHRNALPAPFNYIFFPFLCVERMLIWIVNNSYFTSFY